MDTNGLWEHMYETYNKRPQEPTPMWQLGARHMLNHSRRQRVAVDAQSIIDRHLAIIKKKNYKNKNLTVVTNLYYHALHLKRAGVDVMFVFNNRTRPETQQLSQDQPPPATAGPYVADRKPDVKGKGVERNIGNSDDIDYHRIINGFKEALQKLCIPYYVAQANTIAECSAMNKAGLVDAVMSTDINAFLFGAKTVLKYEKTANKVVLVNEFIPGDHEASAPDKHLNQKVLLSVALLAGRGDGPKDVERRRTDLAIQIGKSPHGDKLWDISMAHKEHNLGTLLSEWKTSVDNDPKTNSEGLFATNGPTATAGFLSKTATFSYPETVSWFIEGILMKISEKDQEKSKWEDEWGCEVDVLALREFTREHFGWKDKNDSFLTTLAPALLPSYVSSGNDASGMIQSLEKHKSNDTGSCLHVKFKLNHIADGLSTTKGGGISSPEKVPEWLVQQACPLEYQKWSDGEQGLTKNGQKRKPPGKQANDEPRGKRTRFGEQKQPGPMDLFVTKTPQIKTQTPGRPSSAEPGAISPLSGSGIFEDSVGVSGSRKLPRSFGDQQQHNSACQFRTSRSLYQTFESNVFRFFRFVVDFQPAEFEPRSVY
ncbi:hypothetical protein PG984_003945 [Apiospora sp. TS-2023a]